MAASDDPKSRERELARIHLYAAPRTSRLVPVVTAVCFVVLAVAWNVREELYVIPSRDLGYALGIAGLAMMVILLGYPARKRLHLLGKAGPLHHWFQAHMVLGVLGPVAVLLHCNFELGSINSSIALVSTLLVASSGFVGRFAYTKIHRGLFGERERLEDLRSHLNHLRQPIIDAAPGLAREFEIFEMWALAPSGGVFGATRRAFGSRRRAQTLKRAIRKVIGAGATREVGTVLRSYFRAARRVAQFGMYERIFSLWHAFHLPICFFLFGAAVVHVIAVHLY